MEKIYRIIMVGGYTLYKYVFIIYMVIKFINIIIRAWIGDVIIINILSQKNKMKKLFIGV